MTKTIVSFVQPNFQQGPTEINAFFLPYSVGCLWAYANTNPEIKHRCQLGAVIWQRQDIETTSTTLSQSDVVAFSSYVWNKNYNYLLAQQIKHKNPKTKIVFGGPEPAVTDLDFFEKYPYIDFVIKQEGEFLFEQLLLDILESQIPSAPGLLINKQGITVDTGPSQRIMDLSMLPSPYLSGFFDEMIQNNPGITWNATLESNRGCPYACTFCDWGSLTYSKVRQFPIERVLQELEWIGQHCELLYVADANFGMFIDRDRIIVDRIVDISNRFGVTKYFYTSWAKNQRNEVIELIKTLTLDSSSLNPNGLTVSVQTMDHKVLDIIKRTNLKQHKIKEIFDMALANQIPVYTEVILGLPGETLASFQRTVYELIAANNHHGIEIIQCQMLENSEMNLVQKKIYDIKTVPVYDYMSRRDDNDLDQCLESIDIVTETSTMNRQDMLQAQVWSSFMHLFHMFGFATQVARYFNKAHDITYQDFYHRLYLYVNNDSYIKNCLDKIRDHYDHWMMHGYLQKPLAESLTHTGVNLITGLTLMIHTDKKIDHVLNLIDAFVDENFAIDPVVKSQLMEYQKHNIVWYEKLDELPCTCHFDFDFYGYLDQGSCLHRGIDMTFDFPEDKTISANKFYENIYYGRKRGFGRSHITKKHVMDV